MDDDFINREILTNLLESCYEVTVAENGTEAMEKLRDREINYSLILLDLLMPEMDGFEVIEAVRGDENLKNIPIIVMTSEADAEVQSIKMGAADFITKPYDMPEVILARCERIIELSENKSIIHSAEKDSLTGLYSRDFFFEYIRQMEKYDRPENVDVFVIDIDHFHVINEVYGRKVGDHVLKKLAEVMMETFEDSHSIGCRLEADTFYVYSVHGMKPHDILEKLEKGISGIASDHIRLRLGVYENANREEMVEAWFDRAKFSCDRVRGDYSNQIGYYSRELHDKFLYDERLINDFDSAIENKDFVVYYQPKFSIQGAEPRLRSAEALIRWKHPELGMISPGHFIPLFESNGLIQNVDRYVWHETAAQIRKWKDEYGMSVPVSVNVSRIDIYNPELENTLLGFLEENNLTPSDMMLEITESAYSENADKLIEVVSPLRDKGFMIEMDDFGSGYSSLNMLTTIPIDVLKLDMKFIRDMLKDPCSMKLVELILDIAKFLNLKVVAEGVEEKAQVYALAERGCDIIQGYYFSKPVPPEEFARFLMQEKERRAKD